MFFIESMNEMKRQQVNYDVEKIKAIGKMFGGE